MVDFVFAHFFRQGKFDRVVHGCSKLCWWETIGTKIGKCIIWSGPSKKEKVVERQRQSQAPQIKAQKATQEQ
jgi:hypothetical protein